MASKSTKPKPAKPYPDFPLFPHASGRWAKKIRGSFCYFGSWRDDPTGKAALELYLDQKDDLHAGRTPRANRDGLTVRDAVNHFLTAKERKLNAGEMSARQWNNYQAACAAIVEGFGRNRLVDDLTADDFGKLRAQLWKGRSAVTVGNFVRRIRAVFKYAYDAGLIDKPMRYGPEFVQPSGKALRKAKAANGDRLLEPKQIHKLLEAATPEMKAMVLLGVNCGFGNTDCSDLPRSAVDLDAGVIDYPRPKTGIGRRCMLWPETVEALRVVMDNRRKPKHRADAGLVFLTKYGERYCRTKEGKTKDGKPRLTPIDSLSQVFGKLLDAEGMKRKGLGFYALRHTFRTAVDDLPDRRAIDRVMGHENTGDVSTAYVERIGDERLQAVSDRARAWLWPDKVKGVRRP